jgi:hypothetical protein
MGEGNGAGVCGAGPVDFVGEVEEGFAVALGRVGAAAGVGFASGGEEEGEQGKVAALES